MHDRDLVGSSFLCLRSRLHSFLSGSWFVPHLTIPHYSLHSWPKAGAAPYSRVPRNERSKRQGIGWKKRPQGETNDERSEWKTDTRFVCSSLVLGSPRSFVPRCPSVVYDPGPEGNREGPGERHGGGNEGNMRPPLTCLSLLVTLPTVGRPLRGGWREPRNVGSGRHRGVGRTRLLPKAWVLHPSSQGLVSQPYRRFLGCRSLSPPLPVPHSGRLFTTLITFHTEGTREEGASNRRP